MIPSTILTVFFFFVVLSVKASPVPGPLPEVVSDDQALACQPPPDYHGNQQPQEEGGGGETSEEEERKKQQLKEDERLKKEKQREEKEKQREAKEKQREQKEKQREQKDAERAKADEERARQESNQKSSSPSGNTKQQLEEDERMKKEKQREEKEKQREAKEKQREQKDAERAKADEERARQESNQKSPPPSENNQGGGGSGGGQGGLRGNTEQPPPPPENQGGGNNNGGGGQGGGQVGTPPKNEPPTGTNPQPAGPSLPSKQPPSGTNPPPAASTPLNGKTFTGPITFYGGNLQGGNCMMKDYQFPPGVYGAAIGGNNWDNSGNCGACAEVTGPDGKKITVMFCDKCPECQDGMDLFPDAFKQLADPSVGKFTATWHFVTCPVQGPLKIKDKEGTNEYYVSMQVQNAKESTQSLEISADGGKTFKPGQREDSNHFVFNGLVGAQNVDVRVKSQSGKTVVVPGVPVSGAEKDAAQNYD